MLNVETYFLRYAFPCTDLRVIRKEITSEKADELKKAAIKDKKISRIDLEKIFYNAFEEIEILSKKFGKNKWDYGLIRDYFHKYHNQIIESGKGPYECLPESLREICKVYKAKVIDVKENVLVVQYNSDKRIHKRNVVNDFVPDAKLDDFVMIHYGYAIEKL